MRALAVIIFIIGLPCVTQSLPKPAARIAGNPPRSQARKTQNPATQNRATQDPATQNPPTQKNATQEPLPSADPGAVSTSPLALPFKRAWQYLTDSAAPLGPTVDGSRILLPLAGGQVVCLDWETGSLIWSSESGGTITSPIALTPSGALIASGKLGADGSDAGASLRSVDRATGLTIWARDYPRAFTAPLEVGENRIFAGSGDGALYALSADDGRVLWKVDTQDRIRGQALVAGGVVYFGGDDGLFRAIDAGAGSPIWTIKTPAAIACRPAVDDRHVYFGSGEGFMYCVNRATGVIKWRSRTGAAIEAAPVLIGDRLLAASFDNFIYCLSRSNGDRIWKRRLENRIVAAPLVEGDANLVAPFRGNYVASFLNADGRRLNIFQLDPDYEIVAEPVFSRGRLILTTDKGLVAAAPIKPEETTPATARGSATGGKPKSGALPQRPRYRQ
jgi:outer membrane protein assembly factor BamB